MTGPGNVSVNQILDSMVTKEIIKSNVSHLTKKDTSFYLLTQILFSKVLYSEYSTTSYKWEYDFDGTCSSRSLGNESKWTKISTEIQESVDSITKYHLPNKDLYISNTKISEKITRNIIYN